MRLLKDAKKREQISVSGKEPFVFKTGDDLGLVKLSLGNKELAISHVKGLNLLPNSQRFRDFACDYIARNGYGRLTIAGYGIDRPLIVDTSENTLSAMRKSHFTTSDNIPFYNVAGPQAFYNMEKRSIDYICRFTWLIDWLWFNYIRDEYPEYNQIERIMAENPYYFRGIDKNGNLVRRFSVHKNPYRGMDKEKIEGWVFFEDFTYTVGMI